MCTCLTTPASFPPLWWVLMDCHPAACSELVVQWAKPPQPQCPALVSAPASTASAATHWALPQTAAPLCARLPPPQTTVINVATLHPTAAHLPWALSREGAPVLWCRSCCLLCLRNPVSPRRAWTLSTLNHPAHQAPRKPAQSWSTGSTSTTRGIRRAELGSTPSRSSIYRAMSLF